MLRGIFQDRISGKWFFEDDVDVNKNMDYFVSTSCGYHFSIWSALYDDELNCPVDEVQKRDKELDSRELYVVTYFKYYGKSWLEQEVDFGLTKDEIIKNIKAQKYIEGATYYTMGHMFWTTKMILEGKWDKARLVE